MPIAVLSYSSLTKLLRNPLIFKMSEILGVYTGRKSVSSMIGSAGHEALKVYYGGREDVATPADPDEARELAMQFGIKYIDEYPDAGIKYGKQGSREKILQGFAKAMQFYFAEEPEYHNIIMCEEKMNSAIRTTDGQELPLPATAIPDLVVENKDGSVDIIDAKFTRAFTKKEDEEGEPYEDYIKIVQAMFLKHLLVAAKGITAKRVIFREIKYSENKEGGSQLEDYVVPCDHEPYDILFYNLYKDVVEFLKNPNVIFLPNFADPFDGQEAGLMYAQGLISGDMSDVEVMHRVKEVAFTSKRFVASRLDRAENDSLLPEERVKVKLMEFGILIQPESNKVGASVTQYRFKVSAGTSMNSITKHKNDILQALMVKGEIRLLTPIPGTKLFGIEVENVTRSSSKLGKEHLMVNTLSLPIGTDVHGEAVRVLLNDMPHLLVAGTTGSGKSVLMHNFLKALTEQMPAEDMELTLIDPKRVELSAYARKPHLHGKKVIFEYEDALRALLSLSKEMDSRYDTLEQAGKRDLWEYNASRRSAGKRLRVQVVVIDELADFMLRAKIEKKRHQAPSYLNKTKTWLAKEIAKRKLSTPNSLEVNEFKRDALIELLEQADAKDPLKSEEADVELLMVRLAQLGRAAGIHLIVATQRPSTDVITGLIKANFPTRIALTTASPADSEVILGKRGAEKLAGKGDLLFLHPANRGELRLQGFSN